MFRASLNTTPRKEQDNIFSISLAKQTGEVLSFVPLITESRVMSEGALHS